MNGDLIAVVQLFRHGHRTPLNPYPKDPYQAATYNPIDLGGLTKKGKNQIYELGCYTRTRYNDFLPTVYRKKDFVIYTTEKERSITSGQLYTAGLYPPTEPEIWKSDLKWNPIPTTVSDPSVLRSFPLGYGAYSKIFTPAADKFFADFKKDPISDYIKFHSGIAGNNLFDYICISDTLATEESLGLELPVWTKQVYPGKLTDLYIAYLQTTVMNEQMIGLFIGPFLNDLVQHFDKMYTNPSSGPKLVVYSGHDTNIFNLLNALGVLKNHHPPFASSLYFELRSTQDEAYVNVYYKTDDIVPISVEGCEFNCKYDKFKEVLNKYIIIKDDANKILETDNV